LGERGRFEAGEAVGDVAVEGLGGVGDGGGWVRLGGEGLEEGEEAVGRVGREAVAGREVGDRFS
jgi:hypothetical protein